ncbi:MAG: DUF2703 domain-containing protein [Anaerosomatales bacterium]|nr:DUF2703 domain-containing protein [Anaerosomatales bacterium]MDT8434989.1 DUF2703 domain-containing protein [Anaerosomatales bacterium]
MTEGAMMTGCCSGGTRVTVDVERLVVEGETCDRCASTWDAARQAVEMVAAEAPGIGLAVDLREVPLSPERISDSNRVLVNGRLVEEWLDGVASSSLSAADIARAIRAAAGLAAPSESPSGDSPRASVVLVTSSECG